MSRRSRARRGWSSSVSRLGRSDLTQIIFSVKPPYIDRQNYSDSLELEYFKYHCDVICEGRKVETVVI